LSDFHVDAEAGGVLDEVLAVAAVDPHLADAGMFGGDLVQELGAGDGVLHARRCDQHGKEKPGREPRQVTDHGMDAGMCDAQADPKPAASCRKVSFFRRYTRAITAPGR
jgi:hypothetical protein